MLRSFGTERQIAEGDVLFHAGDENYDFIAPVMGFAAITHMYRA